MPGGRENIFKRMDGRWEARYVKEVMHDGSRKYGSVYVKTNHETKVKQLLHIYQPLSCTKKSASLELKQKGVDNLTLPI